MNPDITNIDTSSMNSSMMGINMNPTHLFWTTIVTLVLSHFGSKYLAENTPRGYWFWFTILNLIVGFIFM